MRGVRFDHVLAGTALALILATPASLASQMTSAEIEAAVPMPEPANVPPPSISDVKSAPAESAPAAEPAPTAAAPASDAAPAAAAATPAPAPAPTVAAPAPAAADTIPATPPTAAAPVEAPAATAATPAPAAEPAVVVAQNPVAEKIKELFAGKPAERFLLRKADRAAAEAFYKARDYAPLWVEKDGPSKRADAAVAYLKTVHTEGLDPADYPAPSFKGEAEDLAEAELRLTNSVLTYARQAEGGRVHYSRVSQDILYSHSGTEPAEILAKVAEAPKLAETLASFNPPHKGYKALKAKLAEARGSTGSAAPVRIPSGPTLRYGKDKKGKEVVMQDRRVPLLRTRLGVQGSESDTTYDQSLADALAAFQKSKGLTPSGQLNAATLDALNGPRRDRDIDVILANMERWRWMPRDLGKAHVVLNIPDYTLKVYKDGTPIWQTRAVVGKPQTPTPILTETMKYITVNPTWNVPPSIVNNEYLPALAQDPTVLERMGLRVQYTRDGRVHISQPPGDKNALGRIRFNFPNKFLVYQHDTPDKHLFAHDRRAYSHGCMRVQDPLKYGEVLLSLALPNQSYTAERLRKMYGPSEVNIQFPAPIPVHITYQTAYVDDAGKLVIRDDIYGRDSRTIAALKNEDRRVAEIPINHPSSSYTRPRVRQAASQVGGGRQVNFFERLFGGGP